MEKRLKIGLFIDTFFPMVDGVVMVVDNYARRLSAFCDVVVFAPVGRKEFDDKTLPYKVVRCHKKFPLKFLDYDLPLPKQDKKFKQELENEKLDLVHIHSPFSIGKMGVKYAQKHNIPCLATMHSQYKQDFKKSVKLNCLTNLLVKKIMKVFNSCDECWAVNSKMAEIFKGYGAKTLPKVQNNGTDLCLFENQSELDLLKQKYNIKDDEKVFLFLGRLIALKNIFFIIDALKILKDKGFKFKMLFVGSGPDEQKLKDTIKNYQMENEVILTGKIVDRAEIPKHYRLADLFLFPSMYDASSLVQIEAASQKTPTIFLRGSATSATITEDENGYLSENSTEKFAEKILEIFSDEKKYHLICENAYKDLYVLWDDVVKKAFKQYKELITLKNS